ncbi:GvpL/GvpF family gas vesicle protein [Streptomyces sp. DSM 44917]|uniref:GvpL/GvpF family gas vesicle protein n=1 Tax=Streptomyces boetiae TaxID=3075541 RepID=A0ABU2L2N6_9ACTN|nr:GvpL/GvpF family gas vesicle protein [Streptomyces sp. DSM 44917]MDT0305825.1 GvpL/GvpF family gas vesicle protein [Streptomyces sp. DSM 44917]
MIRQGSDESGPRPGRRPEGAAGELWYVYAVSRAEEAPAPPPDGPPGLTAVTEAGLAALASPVPAAEFGEGPLRERLEDLAWLERTARGHQRVVNALAASGRCVVPLRLATVCLDPDGVRRLLAEHRERFAAAVERLDGRAEWGVKIYAAAPQAEQPEDPPGTGNVPSGRDYLRRRARQRRSAEEGWREVRARAHEAHTALAGAAERCRLHPPQDPRLSGESGQNLLNGAYLVPRTREDPFRALVAELAGTLPGVRLSLTGPWVPYSFAGLAGSPGAAP